MKKNEYMDEIKKPKRISLVLCILTQWIGWGLLIAGAVWFIAYVAGPDPVVFQDNDDPRVLLQAVSMFSFDFVFVSISTVILAQLARYIFDKTYRPQILLRCGNMILYGFVLIEFIWAFFRYKVYEIILPQATSGFPVILGFTFPPVVKIIVLIVLAQILKNIKPIIEESKTLV